MAHTGAPKATTVPSSSIPLPQLSRRSGPRAAGSAVSAAKRGLRAARSSYAERRNRADHIGMAVALRSALAPGDHAVDVGAHLGDVTRQILQSTGDDGRVLAVEPLPHLAAGLRQTLGASVTVEECALTDGSAGEAEFLHVKNNPGYSGLRERDYPETPQLERVTVRTRSLDELVEKHGLRPRLIKIDVEGAELLVLRGARETIREYRPVVLVEHGTAALGYGESPATFFDCVTDLGLRVFNFDGEPPYQRGAFVNAVGPNRYFNFLLRP